MKIRSAAAIVLGLALVGCQGGVNPPPVQQEPVQPSAPEPDVGASDTDLQQRIGLALIDAKMSVEMTIVRAQLLQLGAPDSDGKPSTMEGMQDVAREHEKQATEEFIALIREVPQADLKAALKAHLAAQTTFYALAADARSMGQASWVPRLRAAQDEIRKAEAQVSIERKLVAAS